ncbi:TetR family transcriptional regulator [Murinocardiopsis flavida]|uniref:TetR family transcriptional regulator n=1 Tax=Murinocardiopsis flavida TaxID=645275 RepID=A0A2P8DEL4_9ACTN|nr:TetR family transcriptional regulator [Murinocardiopsis flavida]PSK95660.1 TetR family transcriptional regulator [Murinocardiopsis flavida]
MTSEGMRALTPAQRRRERQRQLIIREAARLFEENGGEEGGGFEKTTAEAIAERSDISVSTFFRYFKTKADVIYLDLESAIESHMAALDRRLSEGQGVTEAWVECTIEAVSQFAADEDNKGRLQRALSSPHFVAPWAMWTRRWHDRLTALLRDHLPASEDRDLRARAMASTWLYTTWVAIEQWGALGLDQPLAPILRKSLGLATTAAQQAHEAIPPERT